MKKKNDELLNKITRYGFYLIMLSGIIYSFLSIYFSKGLTFSGLFFYDTNDTFMDFFNSIKFSLSNNPFAFAQEGAIYPPINYLIFGRFLRFFDFKLLMKKNAFLLRDSQQGLILISIVIIAVVLAVAYLLYKILKVKEFEKIIVIICFIFSAPFLFLIERGNILALALIFLLIYIKGIDSENKYFREIALICLGIAAAIKIYPAVFGLMLLYKKRYKEAVRCAVYGLLFFIIPFFHYGGIPSIGLFLSGLKSGIETTSFSMTGVGYRVDLQTILSIVSIITTGSHTINAAVMIYPLSVVLLLLAFIFKEEWKRVLCIVVVMIIFPNFNYEYSMVFYIIPVLFFINAKHHNISDWIYAILFSSMLILIASDIDTLNWIESRYPLTINILVQNIGQCILICTLLIDGFIAIFSKIKKFNYQT